MNVGPATANTNTRFVPDGVPKTPTSSSWNMAYRAPTPHVHPNVSATRSQRPSPFMAAWRLLSRVVCRVNSSLGGRRHGLLQHRDVRDRVTPASTQSYEEGRRMCHIKGDERRCHDDKVRAAKPSGRVGFTCHQGDTHQPQQRCPHWSEESDSALAPRGFRKENLRAITPRVQADTQ
jgi:hypothetical protein